MRQMPASQKLVINCITTSLVTLMEQKDYDKISIVDITRKAGVSRMAFYRNFNTKEDILMRYCNDIFEPYHLKLKQDDITDFKSTIKDFLLMVEQNRSFFGNLIKARLLDQCFDYYMEYMPVKMKDFFDEGEITPANEYRFHFFTGGLMNVVRAYFYHDESISIDELVELLDGILSKLQPSKTLFSPSQTI